MSLVHLNIRSLLPKLNEISLLVSNYSLDVLTLSETWLDESICDAEVSLPGYNLLRQDRNRHGGGVAIFISASIKFTHRSDLQSNSIENLWIELFPDSKRSILICCAYRPLSQSNFFDNLLTVCDLALTANKRIAIMGDLNCNLLANSLSFEYQTSVRILSSN